MNSYLRRMAGLVASSFLGTSLVVIPAIPGSVDPAFATPNDEVCELPGFGTADYPFLVDSDADFAEIPDCDGQNIHFELRRDVDFNDGWPNISEFLGKFDGNEKSVSNLLFNDVDPASGSRIGLFGLVRSGASIVDLTIEAATINAAEFVGVLAASIDENVTVRGITILDAQVMAAYEVGILAGSSSSSIRDVRIASVSRPTTLTVPGDVGGLLGRLRAFGTEGEPTTVVELNNISLADVQISHTAGNSSTRMGALVGLLNSSVNARVEVSDIALEVQMDDTGASTQPGIFFGSNFSGGRVPLDVNIDRAVVQVQHGATNPSSSRPLALLGSGMEAVSFDVHRTVVFASSENRSTTPITVGKVELLGGFTYNYGTTVSSSEVYFDPSYNGGISNYEYEEAATAKTLAELQSAALYSSWPLTTQLHNAVFSPGAFTWVKASDEIPWLSDAVVSSHAIRSYENPQLVVPSAISRRDQLGEIALLGNVPGDFTLTLRAREQDGITVVPILNDFDGQAASHSGTTIAEGYYSELILTGTFQEIDSDLRRLVVDSPNDLATVDFEFDLDAPDTTDVLQQTHSFGFLGCLLEGQGTAEAPYLIQSQSDLRGIMACDAQGVFFRQTADINMTSPHIPIGNNAERFRGIYDGDGFEISNLYINRPLAHSQGLFGSVGDSGGTSTQTLIKNLTVRGSVTGASQAALLVGDVDDLAVENVALFGTASAMDNVALLAGDAEDLKVMNVQAEGRVSAIWEEAGLIIGDGYDDDIWLEDITVRGQVIGNTQIGGVAGLIGIEASRGLFRNIEAIVDVVSVDYENERQSAIGGVVGDSTHMHYMNLSVIGLIEGAREGRVWAHADLDDPDQSKRRLGGLIGISESDSIRDSSASIDVIVQNPSEGTIGANVGGLVGYADELDLTFATYSGTVIGRDAVGGAVGALFDGPTHVSDVEVDVVLESVGYDAGGFAGRVFHNNNHIWIQDASVSGTLLGTGLGPIAGFIGQMTDEDFTLAAGASGTITVLKSSAQVNVTGTQGGLISAAGFIGELAAISNVVIKDSYASGDVTSAGGTDNYSYAGGFIGYVDSADGATVSITGSFATGDVTATNTSEAGGFIGYGESIGDPGSVFIDQSYATGDVFGFTDSGGFLGSSYGLHVSNSYSTGEVTGTTNTGGFLGSANVNTTITNSYTASDAILVDDAIDTGPIGRFGGNADALLVSSGWNSNTSNTDNYAAPVTLVTDNEFEINQDNWDLLATYDGWQISEDVAGDRSVWVICPAIAQNGPVLWYQVRGAGGDCGNAELPELPATLNTGGTPLDFEFPIDVGWFLGVGSQIEYLDIIDGSQYPVDATVTVIDAVGIDSYGCNDGFDQPNLLVAELDDYSDSEVNRMISVELDDLCLQDLGEAFVEISVEFSIYGNPVELEQIVLDINDVDDFQFVELSDFDRYSFAEGTILSARVVDGVTRIEETEGIDTSVNANDAFDFAGSSFTVGRVQFEINAADYLTIKLGSTQSGAAYFDLDFSSGGEWVDERGEVQVLTLENPVLQIDEVDEVEEASANAVPYEGPVISTVAPISISREGGQVELRGTNLESVSRVILEGIDLELDSVSDSKIILSIPGGLELGLKDAEFVSDFGRLTIADLINVVDSVESEYAAWTSLKGTYVKVYAKNIVSAGKVQFFHNGNEIAWVRAVDETDPKLRRANGFSYLVRSVFLMPGKNVFEIYVDGERVRRTAYTLR